MKKLGLLFVAFGLSVAANAQFEARNHVKLQNITYNGADRTIKGYTIEAGRDVDPDRAEGDVVIKGNSNITLDAEHSTVIKGGFSVEKGSTLTIE